jgi:transposase
MMRTTTHDKLRRVANIYEQAGLDRKPPTLAVAKAFDVSKTAAAKLVQRARERGYLPQTERGRATSPTHSPTVASIHRGTDQQRQWTVCQECLTMWPCHLWRTG